MRPSFEVSWSVAVRPAGSTVKGTVKNLVFVVIADSADDAVVKLQQRISNSSNFLVDS